MLGMPVQNEALRLNYDCCNRFSKLYYTVLMLLCTVSAKTLYAIATTVLQLSDAIAFTGSAHSGLHERNKR
jgi:hypothetical protein